MTLPLVRRNGTYSQYMFENHKYGGYTTYGLEDAARLDSINPMISVFENMMHYVNRDYPYYTGDRSVVTQLVRLNLFLQ